MREEPWPKLEDAIAACKSAVAETPKSPDYPYCRVDVNYLGRVLKESVDSIEALVQRLESHDGHEIPGDRCFLDARDRMTVQWGKKVVALLKETS
jgi:hypothetical protein